MTMLQHALYINGAFTPVSSTGALPGIPDTVEPQITFASEVKKTNGGQRWKNTSKPNGQEAVTGATASITIYTSGRTPQECGAFASTWEKKLRAMTRYYIGARYLEVLGVTAAPRQKPGRAMLNQTVTVNVELLDDQWRLIPGDRNARSYPSEPDVGVYPLGLLRVVRDAGTVYDVEPLDGVTLSPNTFVLHGANGATFTFQTLELNYG